MFQTLISYILYLNPVVNLKGLEERLGCPDLLTETGITCVSKLARPPQRHERNGFRDRGKTEGQRRKRRFDIVRLELYQSMRMIEKMVIEYIFFCMDI